MVATSARYGERVGLEPWDYGGSQHVSRAPCVAIVDADGVVVDAEDELLEHVALGRILSKATYRRHPALRLGETVAVGDDSPLRALFIHAVAEPERPTVRALTLGCMDLEGDPSCGRWLGQRPGTLLKFLICRRHRVVHAQDIAEALWGHGGFVSSGTVRQCVHELRNKADAGRPDACQLVVTRQGGYALSPCVSVDADDFAMHVRRGIIALDRCQKEIAVTHLRQAVAMYREDFLGDEPQSEWAVPERERLREHMEDALEALAALYLGAGAVQAAASCLRRLVEMRPYDPDAHRRLLTVLISQGRYSHARRCYDGFSSRLGRTFATTPGFTLADLVPEDRQRLIAPA